MGNDDDDLDKFLTANKSPLPASDDVTGDNVEEAGTGGKSDRWKMLREMANTRRAENKRGDKSNRQKRQLNKENKKVALGGLDDDDDDEVESNNDDCDNEEEASPDIPE